MAIWCLRNGLDSESSDESFDSEGCKKPTDWASVRRRALFRTAAAVVLAAIAILVPIIKPAGTLQFCHPEEVGEEGEVMVELWVQVLTSAISFMCLGLVISSQMKWWLTSPFLSRVRWHVLLDCVNVWLFHFLATHPSCGLCYGVDGKRGLSIFAICCRIFFWFNKLMGFTITKTHLTMLERAFERSLGVQFLEFLFLLFGLSILVASVAFVGAHVAPHLRVLILVVMVIESVVVLSCLSVATLMTYVFWSAHSYAKLEAAESKRPADAELALKAVHFSKRMRWEAPLNSTLVAIAFALHVLWLCQLHWADQEHIHTLPEMGFLFAACLALANCARFANLLSLVEFSPQKPKHWRSMSMTFFRTLSNGSSDSEDTKWKTGHSSWDAKTEELARRGVTLRALLDFYSSLPGRMPHFDPEKHKTTDIVRQVIIPMSQGSSYGDSAAALVMMEGRELLPGRMVTHSWSNRFACLVASVVADALELPSYASILHRLEGEGMLALKSELYWKNKLDITYWICCFSINQHAGICGVVPSNLQDPVTGELPEPCPCAHHKYWSDSEPLKDGQSVKCEMNKFDDMMNCIYSLNPKCSQVIAVDLDFNLFTRAWCVAEIHQAQTMSMSQRMIIFSEENLKKHEVWLHDLKVQEMKASNPQDVAFILSKIDDPQRFDAEVKNLVFGNGGLVQACHMGFERVSLLGAVAQQGFHRSLTSTIN